MSECYVGEIRIWAGSKVPDNWVWCNGQSLSVSQYQVLFALIGITYGGDGVNTFNAPNLQGMLPIGQGQGTNLTNRVIGQTMGSEEVTLAPETLPSHNHTLQASSTTANTEIPGPTTVLGTTTSAFYAPYGTDATKILALNNVTVGAAGMPNVQSHENRMPYTAINYIIATLGLYPEKA